MKKSFVCEVLFCSTMLLSCNNATLDSSSNVESDNKQLESTMQTISQDNSEDESPEIVIPTETMPNFDNTDDSIIFSLWSGIPPSKAILKGGEIVTGHEAWTDEEFSEQYQFMKDMGINLVAPPLGNNTMDYTIKMLEEADKLDMKQLVYDPDLNAILQNNTISDEEAIKLGRRQISEYEDYNSFYGNWITDEPQATQYDTLKLAATRYKEIAPGKMFYLNLFPVYATSQQLATETYDEYIDLYYEKLGLDYICYDNYPVVRGKQNTIKILDDFLYNMFVVKKKDPDKLAMICLQSMGFGSRIDPYNVEQIRIQTNISLAMGFRGIVWFCYFSPLYGGSEGFTPAIITLDGQKTEKYDFCKEVSEEIKQFEKVICSFKWQDVMTFVGKNNVVGEVNAFTMLDSLEKHDRIANFESDYDSFAGVFKDEDGHDGFMVVNYDLPSSNETNGIDITFRGATKVLCYINGKETNLDVQDGKVHLDLKASDAAFLIPLNIGG